MQVPTKYLRAGLVTAIDAAMTANSKTCPIFANPPHDQSLPYCYFADAFVLPRHNKTHEGTTTYHRINVVADDPDEALDLSEIVASAITDRDAAITVDASVKLITWELDSINGPFERDTPDGPEYGVSVRLQHRTHE